MIPDLLGHKVHWLASHTSTLERHREIDAARLAMREISEDVVAAMADPLRLESIIPSALKVASALIVVAPELATKATELRMQVENIRHLGRRGPVKRLYHLHGKVARVLLRDLTLRSDELGQVVDRLRSVLELATTRLQARQTMLAERRSGAAQHTANAIAVASAVIGTSAIVDKDVAGALLTLIGVRNSERLLQLTVQIVVIALVTAAVMGGLAALRWLRRPRPEATP